MTFLSHTCASISILPFLTPTVQEFLETAYLLKERERQDLATKDREERSRAEAERLTEEARHREDLRIKKQRADIQKEQVLSKIDELKKSGAGSKAVAELRMEDLANLDADSIKKKHEDHEEKIRLESANKV